MSVAWWRTAMVTRITLALTQYHQMYFGYTHPLIFHCFPCWTVQVQHGLPLWMMIQKWDMCVLILIWGKQNMLVCSHILRLQSLWSICGSNCEYRGHQWFDHSLLPWEGNKKWSLSNVAVGPQSQTAGTRPIPDFDYTLQTPLREQNIEAENCI